MGGIHSHASPPPFPIPQRFAHRSRSRGPGREYIPPFPILQRIAKLCRSLPVSTELDEGVWGARAATSYRTGRVKGRGTRS